MITSAHWGREAKSRYCTVHARSAFVVYFDGFPYYILQFHQQFTANWQDLNTHYCMTYCVKQTVFTSIWKNWWLAFVCGTKFMENPFWVLAKHRVWSKVKQKQSNLQLLLSRLHCSTSCNTNSHITGRQVSQVTTTVVQVVGAVHFNEQQQPTSHDVQSMLFVCLFLFVMYLYVCCCCC